MNPAPPVTSALGLLVAYLDAVMATFELVQAGQPVSDTPQPDVARPYDTLI